MECVLVTPSQHTANVDVPDSVKQRPGRTSHLWKLRLDDDPRMPGIRAGPNQLRHAAAIWSLLPFCLSPRLQEKQEPAPVSCLTTDQHTAQHTNTCNALGVIEIKSLSHARVSPGGLAVD